MFDAGIISRLALSSNNGSPVSSDRMSTPHTPRAMIGAVKTSVRSARVVPRQQRLWVPPERKSEVWHQRERSNRRCRAASRERDSDPRGRDSQNRVVVVDRCVVNVSVWSVSYPCGPRLVSPVLLVVLLDAVERLDDVVDRGDVDFRGAWLAVAACVAVGAAAAKLTFSTRLSSSDVNVIESSGLSSPSWPRPRRSWSRAPR